MFSELVFAHPRVLLLLLLLPALAGYHIAMRRKVRADIRFVHASFVEGTGKTLRQHLIHLPLVLRLLAIGMVILALARPQSTSTSREVSIEGIDIMICLDISGSMLAEDFKPNRMEAAKQTALDFIAMRSQDRIGMTVFSGESFTLVPLTTDHALLVELASGVSTGMVEDGTAIGDGLATAINGLRDSEAISRVVVLLTDGINNTGVIDPMTAAEIAALFSIRVYTIGVGSSGPVPYPFQTPYGIQYRDVEIPVDEDLLRDMAALTGGSYFWAESQDALEQVYQEIDQLERSIIQHTELMHVGDEFLPFLLLALLLLSLEVLLRNTWLRAIP